MISIGSVMRGPEHQESRVSRLIRTLMKAAAECTSSFDRGNGPAVNVVFHVPGSLGSPDWEGVRDAKFSRKRQLLMVQVAVPRPILDSPELKEYLIDALHKANSVAFQFFREKALNYPLDEAEALVQRIKERLDSQFNTAGGETL